MRVLVFLAVAAGLLFASPISEHGKLSVGADGIIKDKNGSDYVMRGMSMYWYQGDWAGDQPGDKFYTSSVVSSLASSWNASVVRAAIGNVNENTSSAVSMAKNMMDWANSAGIYVIIDNHTHDGNSELSNAKSFFSQVSAYAKQRGYTHVIYEIWNEPLSVSWSTIKSYATSVIPEIRANDADGIIIVGTPNYSSSIGSARLDPITGYSNIMYALHFYAGESGHGNYRNALKGAYCAQFPVFVTEWGTSPASGNGTISTSSSDTWISLLETVKVSHANWSLSNTSESSAALTGTSVTSGFTASGTYVKNVISKLNSGGLSALGLSETSIDCSIFSEEDPVVERDGIMEFGYLSVAANYRDISGGDSAYVNNADVLENTSSAFNVGYTLVNIPSAGTYVLSFRTGSVSDVNVSWSGDDFESGSATIGGTGQSSKWAYSSNFPIIIKNSPSAELNFSFDAGSAGSFNLVRVAVSYANSEDSVNFDISPILPNSPNLSTGNFSFDVLGCNLILHKSGDLEIYSLQGKRKAFFADAAGVVKLNLPSGAYLAVLRKSGFAYTKTIFLK